jgi:hypothetical protein
MESQIIRCTDVKLFIDGREYKNVNYISYDVKKKKKRRPKGFNRSLWWRLPLEVKRLINDDNWVICSEMSLELKRDNLKIILRRKKWRTYIKDLIGILHEVEP